MEHSLSYFEEGYETKCIVKLFLTVKDFLVPSKKVATNGPLASIFQVLYYSLTSDKVTSNCLQDGILYLY